MAPRQNLALKIFCLCCQDCEEPVTEVSKVPNQNQTSKPPTHNSKRQKDELGGPNLQRTTAQSFVGQEKKDSSSSSDFEELTEYNIQTGYCKKNLNRYCQEHWSFQPCLIGRP
ncbi:testis-expressed protein 48 [Nannospalax galili]|uniref:testis-expressed protein 48 n=1 Tax=Nannospalax galili TaxID=1026970 RepID=UPI00111C353E|nr:testis-expressed protein 48 [Nannospalax galili]